MFVNPGAVLKGNIYIKGCYKGGWLFVNPGFVLRRRIIV